jgi:hypothetical protein
VTAEAAIPAISEDKPRLRKHPLTRLDSRGPKWTCSTLMLALLDHPDHHICARENIFASRLLQDHSTAETSRRGGNYDLMAATNAVITRISFCVIMLQQSVLRRALFGIAGIGEN